VVLTLNLDPLVCRLAKPIGVDAGRGKGAAAPEDVLGKCIGLRQGFLQRLVERGEVDPVRRATEDVIPHSLAHALEVLDNRDAALLG
jgi:hypothetical protein